MASPSRFQRILKLLALHRPELRAWAMYDWAITGFYAVVVVTVFPIYFSDVAAPHLSDQQATQRLGFLTTAALISAGVVAPILGALTDYLAVKKRLLGTFAGLGVAAVAGMYFIHEGDLVLASILFIIANVGVNASVVFYDALLPHIARREEIDRVSTAGFAVGYLGATLILVATLVLLLQPQWFGFSEGSLTPVRLSFLGVALWWGVFTIPLLLRVPEPPLEVDEEDIGVTEAIHKGLVGLKRTFGEVRGYRHAFLFLIAFLIYNDGISTIIRMATIYGRELQFEQELLIGAIILVQVVGIPCSFLFGIVADRVGTKATLLFGLFVYAVISVFAYFMTNATHFLILAAMVGLVQGGTQALSRSLFASMIPRYLSGRFFGFFAVFERFSGIAGPFVFAMVSAYFDSSRPGILSIILFFIVGAIILLFVDVDEGRAKARQAEKEAEELL